MRRRKFITLPGVAATSPLVTHAQQRHTSCAADEQGGLARCHLAQLHLQAACCRTSGEGTVANDLSPTATISRSVR